MHRHPSNGPSPPPRTNPDPPSRKNDAMTNPNDQIKAAGTSGADLAGGGHGYRPGGPIVAPKPPQKKGGSVPDLAVVAIAVACAVFGGIWGYTLGLDDGKATRAATNAASSASRPVATATMRPTTTVTNTIEVAVPGPTVTLTVAGSSRKPNEVSPPVGEVADIAGKMYAVGKELKYGKYVSEGGQYCRWSIDGIPGYSATQMALHKGDELFEFDGCAPFRLVK